MTEVDTEDLVYIMYRLEERHSTCRGWISRETGRIYFQHDNFAEYKEPLPEDIDDKERYLPIPALRNLGLGKPVVLRFAREHMRKHEAKIKDFFKKPGADFHLLSLMESLGKTNAWYEYSDKANWAAIRAWCEENALQLK